MIWNIEDTYLGYILKEEKLENSKVAIFDFLDNIRPSRSLGPFQLWLKNSIYLKSNIYLYITDFRPCK